MPKPVVHPDQRTCKALLDTLDQLSNEAHNAASELQEYLYHLDEAYYSTLTPDDLFTSESERCLKVANTKALQVRDGLIALWESIRDGQTEHNP